MDCNSTRYVVGRIESECDSAEHVFDSLFRFILRHQDHFGKAMFDGNPGQILENIRYSQPSDDISACPKSSVLTWRADKALEYIEAEFAEHKYPASSYDQYLVDYAEDVIKAGESIEPVGACLAALLYVSPLPEHIALQSRLGHELFDKLSASKASEFIDILASSVPTQLQGPENDFIRAVNNISRIAPTWDHMKIADLTGPAMKDIRQTDSQLSDKEFFEVYGGDYSKIPADTPVASGFNNLSDTEKNSLVDNDDEPDYVKSFLITNFNKFHQLLQNNALTVYAGLKRANVDQFDKETSNYSSKLSYYNNDIITLNNIFKSVQGISRKHSPELLSDVVDAIVHSYLPALQRFRSTRVYNVSLSSTMASTGLNSMLLGAAAYLPQSFKRVQKHMETEQPKAMEGRVIERRLVNNCGSLLGGDDLTSEFIVPNVHAQDTITTKYFKKLIDIQKEFNGKFITEYRKFLNIIVNVQENSLKTIELPTVQEFVGQFNKVLIRDGHTVVKLTGVLEKHLNKEYIATCEGLIRILNQSKLAPFNGLIPILQNIIKLCDNVLKQTSKVKDEYFLAKKSPIDYDTYENLVNRLENTYVKFSKEDSVKIHDSMARLTNFVASKIVPKGSETTYSRLKEYVAKMADRNEAVKRYFNDIINNNKFHLSQQYSVSANKILKPVIDMSNTLIQENMKAYMWLNEKIDGFEVKDRIKQLKNKTFTEEELNAIANAYVEFNKYIKLNANKLGNKYKNFMKYEPHNVSNFFKCYQLARETIEEIGSVNYLERLYKILGIIDVSSEEWIQFKIGLTNYLALSTIWFDVYKYDDVKDANGSTIYHTWKHIAKNTPATSYQALNSLNKYTELKKGRTYELFNSLNDILTCSEGSLFGPIMQHPEGQANVVDTEVIDKNSINLAGTYDTQFTEYGTALLEVIENKSIYNDYYTIGYSMRQLKNFDPIGENKNNTFYITVLESLYLPVIQQLDKYIELRYTGTMNITSYTSKLMMMGGDDDKENDGKDGKMKAGSVYDYVDQHFDELPTIYGDAMEFYVSAYGIIKHYFAQLEDIRNQKDGTTLSVEFNERSSFAPLREKTVDESIRLIKIYANEYNLRVYLKIVNKYWTNAVGDVQTKTTKAIEMICAEFNNLIVFGNINDLRKIRDGSEHEIDLDRQSQYMDKLNRDMDSFILDAQNVMLMTGMNYDQLYREMMSKACRDMASSSDKIGTLKKWLANVDNPKKINDETRRLFIDAFLTPMMVVNDYWKRFFNSITYLPRFMANQAANQAIMDIWSDDDLRPFTSALLKYSKDSAKTVGDVIDLSLQEYYEDVDSTIHHILGFKQFGESTVKLLVDEIHDKFKEAYKGIKEQFNTNDYALIRSANIMNYVDIKIPTFEQKWIGTNIFIVDSAYGDGSCKLQIGSIDIDTNSFTRFVCCALSKISPHKYLPQFFVDALKSSELLGNTFTELRMMGQNTILGISVLSDMRKDSPTKNIVSSNCPIIDNITSALLYWSSSQNAVETDVKVASQTYKNNVIAIIPLLIYILQKHYDNIQEHHENYMINEHLPDPNHEDRHLIESNITRQIKINAKSEITILINILKALYAEFLPGATSVMFLDTGMIHSDHYLCEVRKMVDDNQFGFKDILANAERFEWLLPFAGIDTGVEYLSNNQQRLTKYYDLISPVGVDADFTHTFDEVLRVMSKCLLYGVLDSLTYSTQKVNAQMLTGGESGVEAAILNTPPADNKPFDEHVIVDLMQANPPVEINNPNGNLIAAKINNSLQKLHTDRSNAGAQGQVLTGNQLFAAKLYEYSKKQGMSMKNLNIELLQKSGILNDYDKLYDKDGNEVAIDEIFIGLDGSEDWANAVNAARIPAEDKKLDIDKKDVQGNPIKYGFKIAKNGDGDYVMKYVSSIGQVADSTIHAFEAIKQQGGSGDKKLDVMKEILVKTARDIEYYTSKASLKDYLMYEKICGLLCFPYKNCSLTYDQMNMLRNNLRFDIQRLSFNYLSSECYIPPEERKHTLITTNQFKELAQICLDALTRASKEIEQLEQGSVADIVNVMNRKYVLINDPEDDATGFTYRRLAKHVDSNTYIVNKGKVSLIQNIDNICQAFYSGANGNGQNANPVRNAQISDNGVMIDVGVGLYFFNNNGTYNITADAQAVQENCQKIMEQYHAFLEYIRTLIQDMITNWSSSQYQNLFNLYVQDAYELYKGNQNANANDYLIQAENAMACEMNELDNCIANKFNEFQFKYLFNNSYSTSGLISSVMRAVNDAQLKTKVKEFGDFLEQLKDEITNYERALQRNQNQNANPNPNPNQNQVMPNYFTSVCKVLKQLVATEQNLVSYFDKQGVSQSGPNYYQMWKFVLIANSDDIKKLKNYLMCVASHYQTAPIHRFNNGMYTNVQECRPKLSDGQSIGLHSIYQDNELLVDMLETYVGNDEELTHILNEDAMWCLIMAEIIMRANFGVFNKALRNMWKSLSMILFQTYVKSNVQYKNIEACVNGLKKDLFVIDEDNYYNTQIDIDEVNENEYQNVIELNRLGKNESGRSIKQQILMTSPALRQAINGYHARFLNKPISKSLPMTYLDTVLNDTIEDISHGDSNNKQNLIESLKLIRKSIGMINYVNDEHILNYASHYVYDKYMNNLNKCIGKIVYESGGPNQMTKDELNRLWMNSRVKCAAQKLITKAIKLQAFSGQYQDLAYEFKQLVDAIYSYIQPDEKHCINMIRTLSGNSTNNLIKYLQACLTQPIPTNKIINMHEIRYVGSLLGNEVLNQNRTSESLTDLLIQFIKLGMLPILCTIMVHNNVSLDIIGQIVQATQDSSSPSRSLIGVANKQKVFYDVQNINRGISLALRQCHQIDTTLDMILSQNDRLNLMPICYITLVYPVNLIRVLNAIDDATQLNENHIKGLIDQIETLVPTPEFRSIARVIFSTIHRVLVKGRLPKQVLDDYMKHINHNTQIQDLAGLQNRIKEALWQNNSALTLEDIHYIQEQLAPLKLFIKYCRLCSCISACRIANGELENRALANAIRMFDDITFTCPLVLRIVKEILSKLLATYPNPGDQTRNDINTYITHLERGEQYNPGDITSWFWTGRAAKLEPRIIQEIESYAVDNSILLQWIAIFNNNIQLNFFELLLYVYLHEQVGLNNKDNIFKTLLNAIYPDYHSGLYNAISDHTIDSDKLTYIYYNAYMNSRSIIDYDSRNVDAAIDILINTLNLTAQIQGQDLNEVHVANIANAINALIQTNAEVGNPLLTYVISALNVKLRYTIDPAVLQSCVRYTENKASVNEINQANGLKNAWYFPNRRSMRGGHGEDGDDADDADALKPFMNGLNVILNWIWGNNRGQPPAGQPPAVARAQEVMRYSFFRPQDCAEIKNMIEYLRPILQLKFTITQDILPILNPASALIEGAANIGIQQDPINNISNVFMIDRTADWQARLNRRANNLRDEVLKCIKQIVSGTYQNELQITQASNILNEKWEQRMNEISQNHFIEIVSPNAQLSLCSGVNFPLMTESIMKYVLVSTMMELNKDNTNFTDDDVRKALNMQELANRNDFVLHTVNNPQDPGDITDYAHINGNHAQMIVPYCKLNQVRSNKVMVDIYERIHQICFKQTNQQYIQQALQLYLSYQLPSLIMSGAKSTAQSERVSYIIDYIQTLAINLTHQWMATPSRILECLSLETYTHTIASLEPNNITKNSFFNDQAKEARFINEFVRIVEYINQVNGEVNNNINRVKIAGIRLLDLFQSMGIPEIFNGPIILLKSLLYSDDANLILNLIELSAHGLDITSDDMYKYSIPLLMMDEILVGNTSEEDINSINKCLKNVWNFDIEPLLKELYKHRCTVNIRLGNNPPDAHVANSVKNAIAKITHSLSRSMVKITSSNRRSSVLSTLADSLQLMLQYLYCDAYSDPYFFQNAFVYDPHSSAPKKLAKCYDESFTSLLFKDDDEDRTPNPPDYYLVPVSYQDYRQNIIPTNVPINGQTSSIQSIISNFTNIVMKDIDKSKFKNLNTTGNLVGGDLYTVDSKELLKLYEGRYTIYDAFIPTTSSSLYDLIRAYYLNIILSLNSYFTKSSFVEILYNSKLYHRFFNSFIAAIPNNVPDKLKVLLALIKQTREGNMVREKVLTNQQVREGYDSQMFEVVENGIEYYEPSAIRRFLEMTFDPFTGNNTNTDKKLLKYIADCQGDKLIDVIMNFERLNLRVGALFQFIKEFEFVKLGDEVDNAKYTNDYRDIEMFDGNRGSVNA